jgi:type III secretion system chaperone SycN
LDDAVADLGRAMSLEGLAVPQKGALVLAFEHRGRLCLERAGEDLLVYLGRSYPFAAPALLMRALDLCHWRHNHPMPVRAGMRGDDLMFVATLGGMGLTGARLEQAVATLGAMHDRLGR